MMLSRELAAALSIGGCIVAMTAPANAQNTEVRFNIPPGDLKKALDSFSRQAAIPIIYQGDEMVGVGTRGYRGRASPRAALRALLRGTGFTMHVDASGAIAIARMRPRTYRGTGRPADPTGPASQALPANEIVVTGTRVMRDGYDAPTPTTVVGSTLLETKAPVTIIDALVALPAFRNSSSPSTAGVAQAGPSGQSFANLRGLGATRTLVLLDGQRIVPSTPLGSFDMGVLPSALIQRIDIVTGGASAAYGSDAVAGVVNVVLDHRLTGVKGAVEGGSSSYGDNRTFRAALSAGTGFAERGHLIVSGEYAEASGVPLNARPDTEYPIARLITNPDWTPENGEFRRLILPYVYTRTAALGGVIVGGPLAGLEFGPGGTTFQQPTGRYVGTSNHVLPGRFDSEAWDLSVSIASVPQEKAAGYARASWDISDGLTVYATGLLARNKPGPFYSSPANTLITGNFVIRRDNIFLPEPVRTRMEELDLETISVGRYSEDLGASVVSRTNDTRRAVLGLHGEVGDGWTIEAYGQLGRNHHLFLIERNAIRRNLALAADAVDEGLARGGAANGNVVCRSILTDPGNGCIPWNIFGPAGTRFSPVSPPAAEYIFGTSRAELETLQRVAAITLAGEPLATRAGPVSFAAGAEYREEIARQTVDALSHAGAFALSNPKPLSGRITVKEAFAETVVPLAEGAAFLHALDVNGAVRFTDYSTSGSVVTWKIGGNWEPVDGLRIRATRSRDIRAPNIVELFSSPVLSTGGVVDPFTNTSPTFQISSVGNPGLRPEKADTTAAGMVVRPAAIPGLEFSADYYRIEVRDAISSLSVGDIVNRCYSGNQALCRLITRTDGAITRIDNPYLNLQSLSTDGIDFEVSYRRPLGGGTALARVLANRVLSYTVSDGVSTVQRAGDVSNAQPAWAAHALLTYQVGRLNILADVTHIGGGQYDNTFVLPTDINDNTIPSRTYLGLQTRIGLGEGDRRREMFFSVSNVFNVRPPPVFVFAGGPNYERVGRSFRVGVNFSL